MYTFKISELNSFFYVGNKKAANSYLKLAKLFKTCQIYLSKSCQPFAENDSNLKN